METVDQKYQLIRATDKLPVHQPIAHSNPPSTPSNRNLSIDPKLPPLSQYPPTTLAPHCRHLPAPHSAEENFDTVRRPKQSGEPLPSKQERERFARGIRARLTRAARA